MRLNEKKRDYMHIFVEDARQTLQNLWESLYFSEDEMLEFTPAWTDIYTDASLAAHESEISRLEQLLQERKPIIALIDAYRELQRDSIELEQSQQDASRLMARGAGRRDPSRLLREEQMRKRIAKRKPKLMTDLNTSLSRWENENGRPFMVNGERFIDVLRDEEMAAKTVRTRKTPSRTAYATSNVPAKDELKTPGPQSVKRAPLQSRGSKSLNSQPPIQPNFLADSKSKGNTVIDPFRSSKSRHLNENTSPVRPAAESRAKRLVVGNSSTDSSMCSGNSPLKMKMKMKAPGQPKSGSISTNLSRSLNSRPMPTPTSAQRSKLTSSVARAKTALGNHPADHLMPRPIMTSTPKNSDRQYSVVNHPRNILSASIDRVAVPPKEAESHYAFSTSSIGDIAPDCSPVVHSGKGESSDFNFSWKAAAAVASSNAMLDRGSSESIGSKPDTMVASKRHSEDVSEFIDDYDDEYELPTASRRLSSSFPAEEKSDKSIPDESSAQILAMSLTPTKKSAEINDADDDALLAIDRLALEPSESSQSPPKFNRFVMDRSGYAEAEMSFISPEHMQPLGYDIPFSLETPLVMKVLPDRMQMIESTEDDYF